MKKFFNLFLFGVVAGSFLIVGVRAEAPTVKTYPKPVQLLPRPSQTVSRDLLVAPAPATPPSTPVPAIDAKAALVLDSKTGALWYDQNGSQPLPLASITKLMSALVFLKTQPDLERTITIETDDLASITDYGTTEEPIARVAFLVGDQVRLKDVLYAALIASANNAVMTLVRATGLSVQEFIRLMNQESLRLNLSAVFVDPTGLERGNMATALDVAKLARYAFGVPTLRKPVGMRTHSFTTLSKKNYFLTTTDRLLERDPRVIAGKTGFIPESGYNLVVKARRGTAEVLVVILGASTPEGRFSEAEKLIRWALP